MKQLFVSVTLLLMALAMAACVAPSGPSLSLTPEARMDDTTLDRALRAGPDRGGYHATGRRPDAQSGQGGAGPVALLRQGVERQPRHLVRHLPPAGAGHGRRAAAGRGHRRHGMAPERLRGAMRMMVPRNATEVFNRGAPEWHTMFWDGRLRTADDGSFIHPARVRPAAARRAGQHPGGPGHVPGDLARRDARRS